MGSASGPSKEGRAKQDFRLEEQRRAQAQGGALIGEQQKLFRRNIEAAQELESRNSKLPGILGGMGQMSRTLQANILRSQSTTATPIKSAQGRTVGVVHTGIFGDKVYSGQRAYDPTGGSQAGEERGADQKPTQETAISEPISVAREGSVASQASRRLLAQGQKSQRSRYFYS